MQMASRAVRPAASQAPVRAAVHSANPAVGKGIQPPLVLFRVRYGGQWWEAILNGENREATGALKFWTQQPARPGDMIEGWSSTKGLLVRLVPAMRGASAHKMTGRGWYVAFDYD